MHELERMRTTLGVVIEQRNSALNQLADAVTEITVLRQQIVELEKLQPEEKPDAKSD